MWYSRNVFLYIFCFESTLSDRQILYSFPELHTKPGHDKRARYEWIKTLYIYVAAKCRIPLLLPSEPTWIIHVIRVTSQSGTLFRAKWSVVFTSFKHRSAFHLN